MIDLSAIYDQIGVAIEDAVGSDLATYKGVPCIGRAKDKNPGFKYPNVMIDIVDISPEGGWQVNEYINDDDKTVHEVIKDLQVSIYVYGGDVSSLNSDRAFYLANQIHTSFLFHSTREALRGAVNAGVVSTGTIRDQPIILADKQIGFANFSVILRVVDSQEDPNSTVISSVEVTGELNGYPDDPDPLTVTITTP